IIIGSDHRTDDVLKSTVTLCLLHQQDMPARFARLRMAAVLRYKGAVLDSIVEDRLLAEASQGSEDQKLVEQLNLDKRQLGQLLLQPPQKLSEKTNQRIEALEGEVEQIEGQLAQHVAGLGKARYALGVSLEQVQPTIPNDGALIEYLRYADYSG